MSDLLEAPPEAVEDGVDRLICAGALTPFGDRDKGGHSVLLSVPIDRGNPGISRLIYNLKCYAHDKLVAKKKGPQAPPG